MSTDRPSGTPRRVPPHTLPVLGAAAFTSMASMRACDAMVPRLAQEFSTSAGAAAQTIAAFAAAYGLLQVAYGPLGDRIGKPRVMTAAALCSALVNLAIALSPSLDAMLLWRTLAGAAAGGLIPLSLALIGDLVPYERRQEQLTRLAIATIVGVIAGQWLGGLMTETLGWRLMFGGLALAFAIVGMLLWRLGRSLGPPAAPEGDARVGRWWHPFGQVLRSPWARVVLLTVGIEGAFAFAAVSFVPSFLNREFGDSLNRAGAIMALYGVGGVLYALASRPMIRRLGEKGLSVGGGLLLGAGMALLALAASSAWAMPACLLCGAGFYMLHSTLQTHATQMLPQVRGTAVSLFVVCLFWGQSAGIALGAVVVDLASARWIFGVAAVVLPLLGAAFARALQRRSSSTPLAGRVLQ